MSTELGIALCALICVVVLIIDDEIAKIKINGLEADIKLLFDYNKVHEKVEANLSKRVDQNSESCSQVDDLGIEVRVCQKDIEHAVEMIEELKAKRSMDILDELREKDKE